VVGGFLTILEQSTPARGIRDEFMNEQDINRAYAKAGREMLDGINRAVAEDMRAFILKTPEEYEAWKKKRDYELKWKYDYERTNRSIGELREKLDWEIKSLAYLEKTRPG
jgi:hypothetical protein